MHIRNHTLVYLAVIASFLAVTDLAARVDDNSSVSQKEVNARFVSEMFPDHSPELHALWLSPELRADLGNILGHPPQSLRIKYHQSANQTLWILDEIGKVKPITIGIFIRAGQIATIRVLKFRESRGWEIKYSFFTDQFQSLGLTEQKRLTASIDGITGATLSVSAMKRVARAALYLDRSLAGTYSSNTTKLRVNQGGRNP